MRLRTKQERRQLAFIYTVVTIVSIVAILWVLKQVAQGWKFKQYVNKTYKFSIKYPAHWSYSEGEAGTAAMFFSPLETDMDFYKESVNIVVQNLPDAKMRLDQYTVQAISQMQAVFKTNFILEESEKDYLDNMKAHRIIFIGKGPQGQGDLKFMIYWTILGAQAYQITYAALKDEYDEYLPLVNIMISSFKFLM